MTTQVPHEPPQFGGYPTSPPWAATASEAPPQPGYETAPGQPGPPGYQAPPGYPAPAGHQQPGGQQPPGFQPMPGFESMAGIQPSQQPAAAMPGPAPLPLPHGSLMVLHPELMRAAARPKAPSWIPVAVFTFLFGLFGAISAHRRAKRAAWTGNSKQPYWIAFGVTMVVSTVLGVIMAISALIPLYLVVREDAAEKALESSIVQSKPANGPAATAADCTPTAERGDDGLRPYTCTVTLEGGRKAGLRVVADDQGNGRQVK
ncbi:hypothetical protein [Paractinoplanes rishiriensis]|uniref:Uncharacterized protein n=1 Tax=Paractinoplanes rishiriensis TaxID=1050105 RepID=A0A919MUX5_9ACTN|nr:hypothetical protein [Actinoplanes rishiriensis]GIF00792.1 hypothetical protein Ari01nite_82560 [Actinoplanes rishiriensis]